MPFLCGWSPDGVSFVGHVAPASGPPAPRASVRCQNRSPRSQNPAPPPAPERHGQSRERPGCLGLERCTRSRGEVTAARCPIGTSLGCTGVARDAIQCVVALRWHAASDPMSETAGLAHAAIAATGGTEGLSANGPAASRQFAQGAGLCVSSKDAGTYTGNVRGFGTRLASTASISPWVTASTRTVGLRTSAVRMMPRRTSSCLCT